MLILISNTRNYLRPIIDKKLGNGWIATAEVLYNKDINSIYHANVALPDDSSADAFKMVGVDNRTIYTRTSQAPANSAVMMKNTSKGYSIYTTLQLQKDFDGALKGLNVNGSYTFGESKSVTDGSSSVAKSAWQYRPAINPNAEELGTQQVASQAACFYLHPTASHSLI